MAQTYQVGDSQRFPPSLRSGVILRWHYILVLTHSGSALSLYLPRYIIAIFCNKRAKGWRVNCEPNLTIAQRDVNVFVVCMFFLVRASRSLEYWEDNKIKNNFLYFTFICVLYHNFIFSSWKKSEPSVNKFSWFLCTPLSGQNRKFLYLS